MGTFKYITYRHAHVKMVYMHAQNTDYYRFSTTLQAHLFGKICFLLVVFGDPINNKSILPNKCSRKVVEK